jgi:hypothetical protein
LWKAGFLPAVRSEEVYFTHHRVLLAAARSDEADVWLRRAADVVDAKADSLHDLEMRRTFLDRVETSRQIVAAAHGREGTGQQ